MTDRRTKCGIHINGVLFSLEKETLSHATMQVNLQGIMQNETSQRQIETDCWLPQPEKWKKTQSCFNGYSFSFARQNSGYLLHKQYEHTLLKCMFKTA